MKQGGGHGESVKDGTNGHSCACSANGGSSNQGKKVAESAATGRQVAGSTTASTVHSSTAIVGSGSKRLPISVPSTSNKMAKHAKSQQVSNCESLSQQERSAGEESDSSTGEAQGGRVDIEKWMAENTELGVTFEFDAHSFGSFADTVQGVFTRIRRTSPHHAALLERQAVEQSLAGRLQGKQSKQGEESAKTKR